MRLTGIFILLAFLVTGCGGNLSEKEREALREEMELREIRQVTDEEIVNQALVLGQAMKKDSSQIQKWEAQVLRYVSSPDDPKLAEIWDAYMSGWESGQDPGENIQRDYPDWILYSYSQTAVDSTRELVIIRIPRKSVVLSMSPE